VNIFKLLAEFHIAADKINLLDIKTIKASDPGVIATADDAYKPRSADAIKASPQFKKRVAEYGEDCEKFIRDYYDRFSQRAYSLHTLVNALEPADLAALYTFKKDGAMAAPASAKTDVDSIKDEIKETEARLSALKSQLSKTRRRSRDSPVTDIKSVLSAIKEEYESPTESQSPQRIGDLWDKLKNAVGQKKTIPASVRTQFETVIKSARKSGQVPSVVRDIQSRISSALPRSHRTQRVRV
jgi:hypothetical protein